MIGLIIARVVVMTVDMAAAMVSVDRVKKNKASTISLAFFFYT